MTSFWWTSDWEDARDYHMPLKQMLMVFVMNSNIFSGVSLCELLSSDTQMSFHWMKGMRNSLTQSHEKDKHWRTLPSLLFLSFLFSWIQQQNDIHRFSPFLHFFTHSHFHHLFPFDLLVLTISLSFFQANDIEKPQIHSRSHHSLNVIHSCFKWETCEFW